MNDIAVFELISGKTILTRYSVRDYGESEILYVFEKPVQLVKVRVGNKEHVAMIPLVGLYPECEIKESAVGGYNKNNIDSRLVDDYIRSTTGIQLAQANPPPNGFPSP